jgi:hypothetical protein
MVESKPGGKKDLNHFTINPAMLSVRSEVRANAQLLPGLKELSPMGQLMFLDNVRGDTLLIKFVMVYNEDLSLGT